MPNTFNLELTLLEPSQAQKHVTVNEALVRLDALGQLVLQSVVETTPPVAPPEGAVYGIPAGAQAPWSNFVGQLATFVNGGWVYFLPRPGWRAWLLDADADVVFDGVTWRSVSPRATASGAVSDVTPLEFVHVVSPGVANLTTVPLPANCVVFAVTARVTSEITGSFSTWRLGVESSDDRYGSGLGGGLNSFARGLTGTPLTYYEDTPLQLTAEGGVFAAGEVTFVVHLLRPGLPTTV
jgi:hypothetical protein